MAADDGNKREEEKLGGENGQMKKEKGEVKTQAGRILRSRKRKEEDEEDGSKEAADMRIYLETGKIAKGRELRRTPVKEVAGNVSVEERDSDSHVSHGSHAEENEAAEASERAGQRKGGASDGDGESGSSTSVKKKTEVCEKWGADLIEWMENMCARMEECECRLERERVCKGEIERDLEIWREKNKKCESDLIGVRRELEELAQQLERERERKTTRWKRDW